MISGSIANQQNVRMSVPVTAWAGVGISLVAGLALTFWEFAYVGVAIAALGSALAMAYLSQPPRTSDESSSEASAAIT